MKDLLKRITGKLDRRNSASKDDSSNVDQPRLSVVILNWQREKNFAAIFKNLSRSKLVNDIIVWNNNPNSSFQAPPNVRVINTSEDFGVHTRFAAGLFAKNSAVLMQDDDLLIKPEGINFLFQQWQEEPEILHGFFGRAPYNDGTYNPKYAEGEVEIVLTRAVILKRDYCPLFFQFSSQFSDIEGEVLGNGEDIIVSYLASSVSKQKNRVYPPGEYVEELPEHDSGIRHSKDHLRVRSEIIRRSREVFYPPNS